MMEVAWTSEMLVKFYQTTTLRPWRQPSSYTSPREPQILLNLYHCVRYWYLVLIALHNCNSCKALLNNYFMLRISFQMWRLYLRLVAFAALCLCTLAQAQSDLHQLGDKINTNKYCGRNLANMLRYVCNGNYYPMFKKASEGKTTVA
jgi:hypothetical protein